MDIPQMDAENLLNLLGRFEQAEIKVWLDGGWGVDALLESQTRPHKDLDIFLLVSDVPRLQELLAPLGFNIQQGSPPHSFVLTDGKGLEIDVHAMIFDELGRGIYRMENGMDWIFPADSFIGLGKIGERIVKCLSPEAQILCHAQGYMPVEKDFQDMEHLQQKFDLDLPANLQRSQV